jgi:hypothetical protein
VILVVGMAGRKIGQHAAGQDHPHAPRSSTITLKRRPRSA